ncbi:hypothetical protein [Streptomyces fuscichromogenes]|uniref:hypothetical protein n=1 Tax=Streptomyces fuscichromogenes TaxID=1324013 RepID=UPI00166FA8EB|nr:hypothetical protein [Streptomyces fuscichromogenes]
MRTLLEGLALPDPFDTETFLALLAERRGRPIQVLPVTVDVGVPCGLLVTTDHADYILCTPGTSALHRQHILVHEAAHLLCGHDRSPAPEAPGVRALLPGLSPDLVRRVLGRTVYAESAEQLLTAADPEQPPCGSARPPPRRARQVCETPALEIAPNDINNTRLGLKRLPAARRAGRGPPRAARPPLPKRRNGQHSPSAGGVVRSRGTMDRRSRRSPAAEGRSAGCFAAGKSAPALGRGQPRAADSACFASRPMMSAWWFVR